MGKKTAFTLRVMKHLKDNWNEHAKDAAQKFNVSVPYIYQLRAKIREEGVPASPKPKKSNWIMAHIASSGVTVEEVAEKAQGLTPPEEMAELGEKAAKAAAAYVAANTADNVNHPAHYKVGGIETIDFIEAKKLNYNLGNVVKYITRADHKGNAAEDLAKARWYLNREIAKMTNT